MLKLYFTKEEMKSFLEKEGYTVKTVKGIKSYNTYHNQVEDSCFDCDVAFKDEIKFTDPNEKYMHLHLEKYLIEGVFHREIKNKLLSL